MTFILRDYQNDLIDRLRQRTRRYKRVIACSFTGSGKSAILSSIAATAESRGRKVWILAHRRKLISQLSATVSRWGVEHGIIQSGAPQTDHAVQVGSVATVVRRLDRYPAPDLIIVDECHHTIEGNQWGRVIAAFPDALVLGFTASPQRLDGRGLGDGHGGYFQDIVHGPSVQWLTDNGYLARATVYSWPSNISKDLKVRAGDFTAESGAAAMNKPAIMGDVIAHYREHLDGKTAIANCCTIKHAESVAESFRAAGIPAAALTGNTDKDEQDRLFDALERGELKVLCQVEVVSEGVDIPSVSGALMLRPTQSIVVWLQQCGRVLRPKPDGSKAIILDFVGNALRLGLPTDHREWSLEGKPKRSSDAPSVRVCLQCYAASPNTATHCGECGHEFPVQTAAEIAQVAGELQELAPKGLRPGDTVQWRGKVWYIASHPRLDHVSLTDTKSAALALARGRGNHYDMRHVAPLAELTPTSHKPRRPSAGASSYEELLAIERQRNYKPGWARHVFASRQRR